MGDWGDAFVGGLEKGAALGMQGMKEAREAKNDELKRKKTQQEIDETEDMKTLGGALAQFQGGNPDGVMKIANDRIYGPQGWQVTNMTPDENGNYTAVFQGPEGATKSGQVGTSDQISQMLFHALAPKSYVENIKNRNNYNAAAEASATGAVMRQKGLENGTKLGALEVTGHELRNAGMAIANRTGEANATVAEGTIQPRIAGEVAQAGIAQSNQEAALGMTPARIRQAEAHAGVAENQKKMGDMAVDNANTPQAHVFMHGVPMRKAPDDYLADMHRFNKDASDADAVNPIRDAKGGIVPRPQYNDVYGFIKGMGLEVGYGVVDPKTKTFRQVTDPNRTGAGADTGGAVPGLTPSSQAPQSGSGGNNSTLTKDQAQAILKEAGGDKELARQLARKRGFTF